MARITELDGQPFFALNGGPHFKFTEAISFMVDCQTQEEVDDYWRKLTEKARRATQAMLQMKKIDIAELKNAYEGR